jgi:hypothetical protein
VRGKHSVGSDQRTINHEEHTTMTEPEQVRQAAARAAVQREWEAEQAAARNERRRDRRAQQREDELTSTVRHIAAQLDRLRLYRVRAEDRAWVLRTLQRAIERTPKPRRTQDTNLRGEREHHGDRETDSLTQFEGWLRENLAGDVTVVSGGRLICSQERA